MGEKSEFVQSLYNQQSFEDFKKEQKKVKKKQGEFREFKLQSPTTEPESNDATSTKYTTNPHLKDKAIRGAQSHALWEQEHPNLTQWGYLASTIPFVVATTPFLTAAGEATAGTTLASNIGTLAGNVAKAYPKVAAVGKAALATPMVYNGVKDVSKGKFTPTTALDLTAGIPAVPGAIDFARHPGTFVFDNLPYKNIYAANRAVKNIAKFFKTPINQNPFKSLIDYQRKRYLASSRPLNITSENQYAVNQDNSLNLLRQRVSLTPISKYDVIGTEQELENAINIPVREHTSLTQAFKDMRHLGESKLNSFLLTPFWYVRANTNPAFLFYDGNRRFVQLNWRPLKAFNFNPRYVLPHELAHSLWRVKPKNMAGVFGGYIDSNRRVFNNGFNFNSLPEDVRDYFIKDGGNELAARGTQLKNYFGISDNSPITGDMLKYAAKNYVKDTGLNNNMNQMFRSITDWDKAAEWLSKYSYKNGGKLNARRL